MKVLCRKTADQAITSTTFVDATGMSFDLQASRTYVFRFWVHFTTGANDQMQFAVNGPASPTAIFVGGNMNRTVLAGPAYGAIIAYNTVIRASTSTEASSKTAFIEGIVRNGVTAGTFTLRFQSESGGGGASVTMLANSSGELDDVTDLIGNAGTGAVGTVAPSTTVALTGVSATGSVGSIAAGVAIALAGVLATGSVGSVGAPAGGAISISGVSATGAVGTLAPTWDKAITGNAATGAVGTPGVGVSVALTGNAAAGQVGNVGAPGVPPDWIWCGAITPNGASFALRTPSTASAVLVKAYAPTISTTLSGSEASGQTVLSMTSITGFADQDEVCIREGHLVNYRKISGTPSGGTITVSVALDLSFTTAARVIRMAGLTGVSSNSVASGSGTDQRVKVAISSGLSADTEHFYRASIDGGENTAVTGWFITPPANGTPKSFAYVAASCSDAMNSTAYQRISDKNPRLFCHMGDMNYIAPASTAAAFRALYSGALSTANQGELVRHTPVLYTPDDQDGAANDGYSGSTGVAQQQASFRENTPTAADLGTPGNWQSVQIGRILFVATDGRTERSINSATDNSSKILWSTAQKAWFQARCEYAKANNLAIAWIEPVPYVKATTASDDTWGGYSVARTAIADIIVAAGVQGQIFIMSGDMHALATKMACPDYSTGSAGAVFPVIQAAAIDRATTGVKGGPYDQTPFEGPGQYGLFTVTDTGTRLISIRFQGKSVTDTDLIDTTFTLDVGVGITGVQATGSVGSVTASRSVALTGNAGTGAVGTLARGTTVAVTGNAATGAVGTVSASTGPVTVGLTGVAGTGAVGTITTSRALALTGNAATGSVGIVAPSTTKALTGNAATGAVGALGIGGSTDVRVIQEQTSEDLSGASADTQAVSITLSAGSALVVFAWSVGIDIFSVTLGATPGTLVDARAPTSLNSGVYFFRNVAGGAQTVTVSWNSAAAFRHVYCAEIARASTSASVDGHTFNEESASPSSALTSGTATSTYQPALVFGISQHDNPGDDAPVAGSGFTTNNITDGFTTYKTEWKRVTATGSQSAAFTSGSSPGSHNFVTYVLMIDEVLPPLTGNQATGSVGTVGTSRAIALTGVVGTGAVGTLSPAVARALTGVSGTGAVGTLSVSVSVPITGNAGTGAVGSASAARAVALTGTAGAGQIGTLGAGVTVAISGVAATASVGSIGASVAVAISGVSATGAVGSVGVPQPTLTGVQATGLVGTAAPSTTLPISGNSAAGAIGSVTPAVAGALTGNSATSALGSVTYSISVAAIGVAGTGAVGTAVPSVTVALTGVLATGAVGSVSASAPGTATLSGVTGTTATGVVTPSAIKGITGNGATAAIGAVGANVSVALTGVSGTGAVGSVAFGGSVVALVGVGAAAGSGTVAPGTTVAITGVSAAGAVGSVATPGGGVLVGVSATGDVGTVTPSVSRSVSGVGSAGAAGAVAPVVAVGLTGVAATGAAGSVSVGTVVVAISGNQATGAAGSLSVVVLRALVGVQATGAAGLVAPLGTPLTGVGATGGVGSVGVAVTVSITGVSAVGFVGTVVGHDNIVPPTLAMLGNSRTRLRI